MLFLGHCVHGAFCSDGIRDHLRDFKERALWTALKFKKDPSGCCVENVLCGGTSTNRTRVLNQVLGDETWAVRVVRH